MSLLGVYFGPKSINIVETQGKKILHNISIPQSALPTKELEEKVPADVKLIEIVALLKDELRRNNVSAKDAVLCLSGHDLIIRSFEMPQLSAEELNNAARFEAKKYIPFKIEELVTDFQAKPDKVNKVNSILFMGIKKETLERYASIFTQLEINLLSVEYAGFSGLRLMKLVKAVGREVCAVLSLGLSEGDEINFSVLEGGFPIFSRDISLGLTVPQEGALPSEEGSGVELEKLKTEIRVSLDYYHRKFPAKNIKDFYLACDQAYRADLEGFLTEIGLKVSFADLMRVLDKSYSYSLSFLKAYSASLFKQVNNDIRINFLGAVAKAAAPKKEKAGPFAEAVSVIRGLQLDYRMILLGVLLCAGVFGYGIFRKAPVNRSLNEVLASRVQVVSVNPQAGYAELADTDTKYKNKLASLDNLIKEQLLVTSPLNIIPQVLPDGAWLTHFGFNRSVEGNLSLMLDGTVYLDNSNSEFEAVNQFIFDLKENRDFSRYFTDIDITSVTRGQYGSFTSTNFQIVCKNYKGAD